MRKRFILLKETPELKKGAILEEECDNGEQDFECVDKASYIKDDQVRATYSRKTVMEGKEWFEEVQPFWIPAKDVVRVKELLKIK